MSTVVAIRAPRLAPFFRTPPTAGGSNELANSGPLFFAYLLVVAIEYGGLSTFLPILKVTRLSTLLAWGLSFTLLMRLGTKVFTESLQNKLLTALVLWTGFSVFWAVVRSYVPDNFRYICDYFGLFVATLYLVDRPARAKWLSATLCLTMIVGVANNLDNLAAGTRLVRFRASYFMGDGNDFAWAMALLLLGPAYLLLGRHGVLLRLLGLVGGLAGVAGIILTQSRGGSLALGGAALFYWAFLSRRKLLGVAFVVFLAIGALSFAPSGYVSRMGSIQDYEEDASAQGRLRAWKAALQMGIDYPLGVGAGSFSSAYGRFYRPDGLEGWAVNRWISAHSVYFKVVGEYGFGGLTILVALLFANLRSNQQLVHRIRANPANYAISDHWPAALNVGLVGYAVGAAFLGGVIYPHLFIISGLSVGCRRIAEGSIVASEDLTPELPAPENNNGISTDWRMPTLRQGAAAVAGVTRELR